MHYFFVAVVLYISLIFDSDISSAFPPEKAEPSDLNEQKNSNWSIALNFVQRVKARFTAENKYKRFLEILAAFKKREIGYPKVYQEMHEFFKDNEDLFREFLKYMPEEYQKIGNETPKRKKIEIKKEKGIKIETNSAAASGGSDDDDDENGGQKGKNLANENGQTLKKPKKEP